MISTQGRAVVASVAIYNIASSILEVLIIVLVSSAALIVTGVTQCYRSKTGLFKDHHKKHIIVSKTERVQLSSILRQHSSKVGVDI